MHTDIFLISTNRLALGSLVITVRGDTFLQWLRRRHKVHYGRLEFPKRSVIVGGVIVEVARPTHAVRVVVVGFQTWGAHYFIGRLDELVPLSKSGRRASWK